MQSFLEFICVGSSLVDREDAKSFGCYAKRSKGRTGAIRKAYRSPQAPQITYSSAKYSLD
jgi:hypothetical protein